MTRVMYPWSANFWACCLTQGTTPYHSWMTMMAGSLPEAGWECGVKRYPVTVSSPDLYCTGVWAAAERVSRRVRARRRSRGFMAGKVYSRNFRYDTYYGAD